jgi:hypothetical protein
MTVVDAPYPVWTSGRAASQPFVISGRIRYSEDSFQYRPGGAEIFKWGWIQFYSIYVLVAAFVLPIMGFMIKNQMVINTRLAMDRVPTTGVGAGASSMDKGGSSSLTSGYKQHAF